MTERRRRTLTEEDVEAIAEALKGHATCNLGLTTEQASMLKRILGMLDWSASALGKAIVYSAIGILGSLLVTGFWGKIAAGLKAFGFGK